MPRAAYKPEEPRPGTEEKTTQKNIQNAYAILNRVSVEIENLENSISGGGPGGPFATIQMLKDCAEFALMMGIE